MEPNYPSRGEALRSERKALGFWASTILLEEAELREFSRAGRVADYRLIGLKEQNSNHLQHLRRLEDIWQVRDSRRRISEWIDCRG